MNEENTLANAFLPRDGKRNIAESCDLPGVWRLIMEYPVISGLTGEEVCGEVDVEGRTIRVNTRRSIPAQLDTLIHESIHAAEYDVSELPLLSEQLVNALAFRITANLLAAGVVQMSEEDEADHREMMEIQRRWQEGQEMRGREVAALAPRVEDGEMRVGLIVAIGKGGVIGLDGDTPWPRLREDMKRFRATTQGHAVIVGRKTFESMPTLGGRDVIVLTRRAPGCEPIVNLDGVRPSHRVASMAQALKMAEEMGHGQAWVCGGSSVYRNNRSAMRTDEVRITRINAEYEGDTFFSINPGAQGLTQCLRRDVSEAGVGVELEVWMKPHAPYLGPPLLPETREMEE